MIKIIIAGLLISFLSLMSFTESRGASFGIVIIEGACCFPDGSCEDGTSISCVGVGDFQGDETECSSVECPQPAPTAPTVIVPTMGQWGMIFSALLLGFYAVLRLRKRKGSEN